MTSLGKIPDPCSRTALLFLKRPITDGSYDCGGRCKIFCYTLQLCDHAEKANTYNNKPFLGLMIFLTLDLFWIKLFVLFFLELPPLFAPVITRQIFSYLSYHKIFSFKFLKGTQAQYLTGKRSKLTLFLLFTAKLSKFYIVLIVWTWFQFITIS